MTTLLWKQAPGIVKAVGDGKVEAVMSTEVKDRDGDIIRQRFWDLDDFIEHPVFVADHQYDLLHQIGRWDGVKVMEVPGAKDIDGEPAMQLIGTATYYIGKGNERADWAYKLAQMGAAAFSVGFIPDMNKAVEIEDKGMWPAFEFRGQKLLETSQVVVPSNPEGLQRAVWAKSLKQADKQPDSIDPETFMQLFGGLEDRVAELEASSVDKAIERLKAEYPKLFETTPELQELIARW